jgi:hypothetical protein
LFSLHVICPLPLGCITCVNNFLCPYVTYFPCLRQQTVYIVSFLNRNLGLANLKNFLGQVSIITVISKYPTIKMVPDVNIPFSVMLILMYFSWCAPLVLPFWHCSFLRTQDVMTLMFWADIFKFNLKWIFILIFNQFVFVILRYFLPVLNILVFLPSFNF